MAQTIVIAELSTSHFSFLAVGATHDEAETTMRDAWNKHVSQTGASWDWDDIKDDVKYHHGHLGTAFRDGSVLIDGSAK